MLALRLLKSSICIQMNQVPASSELVGSSQHWGNGSVKIILRTVQRSKGQHIRDGSRCMDKNVNR